MDILLIINQLSAHAGALAAWSEHAVTQTLRPARDTRKTGLVTYWLASEYAAHGVRRIPALSALD